MKIEDLFSGAARRQFWAQPETDPLTEASALQEAQLIDVRLYTLTAQVGLLFDLRTSLQFIEGNTGLLVAHGAREIEWKADARKSKFTAWNVVSSEPSVKAQLFTIRLGFVPAAHFTLAAASAEFYVGSVDSLGAIPADFGSAGDTAIRRELASWNSPFSLLHAVCLDPSSSS